MAQATEGVAVEREDRQMTSEPERPGSAASPGGQATAPAWSEGDASLHLEELVVAPRAAVSSDFGPAPTCRVELVGVNLRLRGTLLLGGHRRLSDFLNNHEGLIELHDAIVLRRSGEATRVTADSIWVSPSEVSIIGDLEAAVTQQAPSDLVVPRVRHSLVVVTPGHTLTGDVFLAPQAELAVFIASPYPAFVPITNVRTRSLADRRIVATYDFVLMNRSHIVAATGLQPGMSADLGAI
jgi:hypothetical protein